MSNENLRGVWRSITRQDHISNTHPRRRRIHLDCEHIFDIRMDVSPHPSIKEFFEGSEVSFFCTKCEPDESGGKLALLKTS